MKMLGMLLCFVFLLAGCGQNDVGENNRNDTNRPITVSDSNIKNVDKKSGQEISRRLVEIATDVPDVNDATAVVLGNYAIVGIDVDSNIDRSKVGTIKYSVAESLKNDPYGADAIVVADPDVNARLKEIAQDIRAGKPGQGIINELADMAGRLMPEIPKNLVQPGGPEKGPEKPKNELNNTNDKQLEQEQEKQSEFKK